ncbi:MAG: zinc ABC transporter substrate-binding protein [Thermomicrobiales bacterium]|nr:zinc ABC transporter substrate-binding protein [Thermomicrobiales bacterium]
MKRIGLALFLAAMAVSFTLPQTRNVSAQDEPVRVVATFSILADIVHQVGGDHVDITTLVTPNMDAHSFEPSPDQIVGLTDASLIFEIGIDFEPWLDRMVDAAQPDADRVVVSEGVEVRSAGEDHEDTHADDDHDEDEHEEEQHEEDEHDDDHHHGPNDPHIWTNPLNVMIMVENITAALAAADPAHQADYEANAAAYTSELEALDQWIVEQVETIPPDARKLVTSHDTFGYFADRYGFQIIGTPLGTSTAASDPSAADIAELIEAIKSTGVPAVFTENVINPDLMEQLAENAGVELAPSLYTDALGEPGTPGDSYLGLMRFNTETIVTALTS